MAIFSTDFSEFPTGAKPTGWITGQAADRNTAQSDEEWNVIADAAVTGGQLLRFSATVNDERSILWPDVPSSEHQRAQMRWRPNGQNGSDLRFYARAADVVPDSATGYTLGVRTADLDINKYNAGSFSNFANDTGGYTAQDGTWYLTEIEVVGVNPTTLRVKTWPESGTKPASWSVTGTGPTGAINDTDATDIESGGFGLFSLVDSDVDVDWLVVTTAGEDPEFVGSGPSVTNIDGGTTFTPGAPVVMNGTNLSTTGGSINIGGVAQTITNRTETAITFTAVRGVNPYDQDLTLTYTDASSNTATLTVQQVAGANEYAVTAASPNTTDDASLWTGLVDTDTGDPITIVDGDQALLKDVNTLGNLTATPAGEISADSEGDFVVQIRLASEGVWGSDQTVTFSEPDEVAPTVTSVDVPTAGSYAAGQDLDFTVNASETVTVTTTGGTPSIPVTIGANIRQATYVSGSGTSALLFRYTTQAGDNDGNGISVGFGISLNGGTIQDGASNNLVLTLNSIGDTSGVLVDTVKPVITPNGANPATVVVGGTYTDAGATATDNIDGSLGSVTGTGTVDTNTIGQYTITYPGSGVVDSAGNVAEDATRTVNVVAEDPWPFGKGIKYAATKNWEWGKRHPKTGMRVRVYK